MEPELKNRPPVLAPKIGEKELSRIFDLKEDQDLQGVMQTFALRYRKLGWSLIAVDVTKAAELQLDFNRLQELWSPFIANMTAKGVKVGLGGRTGKPSRLFVMDVQTGKSALEHLREWQSECLAQGNGNLECHYYVLPPGCRLPSASLENDSGIRIYGEGSLTSSAACRSWSAKQGPVSRP